MVKSAAVCAASACQGWWPSAAAARQASASAKLRNGQSGCDPSSNPAPDVPPLVAASPDGATMRTGSAANRGTPASMPGSSCATSTATCDGATKVRSTENGSGSAAPAIVTSSARRSAADVRDRSSTTTVPSYPVPTPVTVRGDVTSAVGAGTSIRMATGSAAPVTNQCSPSSRRRVTVLARLRRRPSSPRRCHRHLAGVRSLRSELVERGVGDAENGVDEGAWPPDGIVEQLARGIGPHGGVEVHGHGRGRWRRGRRRRRRSGGRRRGRRRGIGSGRHVGLSSRTAGMDSATAPTTSAAPTPATPAGGAAPPGPDRGSCRGCRRRA